MESKDGSEQIFRKKEDWDAEIDCQRILVNEKSFFLDLQCVLFLKNQFRIYRFRSEYQWDEKDQMENLIESSACNRQQYWKLLGEVAKNNLNEKRFWRRWFCEFTCSFGRLLVILSSVSLKNNTSEFIWSFKWSRRRWLNESWGWEMKCWR